MGLMPIVAPYVAQAKKRYDEIGAQLAAVQDIAEQRRPTIFVEGDSDRVVLAKAWQLFSGVADNRVYICAGGEAYGGASALHSRSLAWMLTVRHRPVADRVKAASVFDNDATGNAARVGLGNDVTRMNLGNCGLKSFKLDTPLRLQPLARRGFNVSVDLESYYSDAVWERAIEDGWLEPIDNLADLLSPRLLNRMAAGGANPFTELNENDTARICNKFNDQGKRRASMFIQHLNQADAERELESFRPMIDKLRGHLFQEGAAVE